MVKLGTDRTLFELAIDRLEGLIPPDRILVATAEDMADDLRKSAPQIPEKNYILEPAPRGTAAVVALAAAYLKRIDPSAVMAVLTADHLIENVPYFKQLLSTGEKVARMGYLVTLGIEPAGPSTAYGYIQRGEGLTEIDGQKAYLVKKFKEKPGLSAAEQMLASGDHDWNSGMFIWQIPDIREEIERQMPELHKRVSDYMQAKDTKISIEAWMGIKPQTIDYGIMEHAGKVAVLPAAGLGWNDVGSWDSLFDVFEKDANGNISISATTIDLDTKNTLVVSENKDRLIATIGIENLVIVDANDILLVCHASKAQQVREIVKKLQESGTDRYL
jgi:mannose-1-phosphate guanylyltransferase